MRIKETVSSGRTLSGMENLRLDRCLILKLHGARRRDGWCLDKGGDMPWK
jgi:hypothetical protein